MDKTEVILVLGIVTIIAFIFIGGVLLFVFEYRKRKIMYEREKQEIEKQHKLDLLNTQLQIQQQTMHFIGREIHDSVAQKLTLASIYTQRMEFENHLPEASDKLAGISKIINDSLLELRQLSKNLTDNKLQSSDLQELIRMECEQVNATGICVASSEITAMYAIDIATKSSLFRIIQEFIQNSIKHSGCKEIKIHINAADDNLEMVLQDDGKGFEIDKEMHKGIGLGSIHRRIQLLGGKYNFESEINKGVRLKLSIPLNHSVNS